MPQPAEIVFCVNLCRHALFKILKVKLYLVLNVSKYKSTSKSFEIYAFLFFIMYTEQKTGRLLSTLNKYRFESLVVFVWNISRLTTCIMLKIVINGSFWFYLTMYNHIYIIKKTSSLLKYTCTCYICNWTYSNHAYISIRINDEFQQNFLVDIWRRFSMQMINTY